MPVDLPDWCELVRGDGPVLLVAPHGGRRPPVDPTAPPANLKVNDVHTAELTRELAARLGAAAVINHGCDRNSLDLNRISQVRRQAAWFLALLRAEIAAILARHEQAEILFVHGWNVGQVKCDLGFGAREREGGLVIPDGARQTVTAGYLEERIAPLRVALGNLGVANFVGVRYPASHPNNLLQVFACRPPSARMMPEEVQFSQWASAGRLQAVQLELGVPLRWPGIWRQRLVECLVAQFGPRSRTAEAPPRSLGAPTARRSETGDGRRATSLQFYDPEADIGLLAGIGPVSRTTTAARLLLFLGGQRVALFTGEQTPPRRLSVEPLHFETVGEGMTVRFGGPILHIVDGATYLDLEAAFVASTLGDVEVELCFTCGGTDASGAGFGRVDGFVDLGGERRTISTGAYANAGAPRGGQRLGYAMLAADFGGGHGVLANVGSAGTARVVEFRGDGMHDVPAAAASSVEAPLELPLANGSIVRATPVSRMEILRSLADGEYTRVTFGTARFDWEGRAGQGVYEYAMPV